MKKIQIFSPHIDDAVLSLGGSMFNWRNQDSEITIKNIFSISDWTHSDSISNKTYGREIEQITALRKREEYDVANKLNMNIEFFDFFDFPLRSNFSMNQTKRMMNDLKARIISDLNTEDYFFFPLGIEHPDHKLIRGIGESFAIKADVKYNIFFYEDLPYFSWGTFDYGKAYHHYKKDKSPILELINFEKKIELVKKYRSQITEEFVCTMRAYSYDIIGNAHYERYWLYDC